MYTLSWRYYPYPELCTWKFNDRRRSNQRLSYQIGTSCSRFYFTWTPLQGAKYVHLLLAFYTRFVWWLFASWLGGEANRQLVEGHRSRAERETTPSFGELAALRLGSHTWFDCSPFAHCFPNFQKKINDFSTIFQQMLNKFLTKSHRNLQHIFKSTSTPTRKREAPSYLKGARRHELRGDSQRYRYFKIQVNTITQSVGTK